MAGSIRWLVLLLSVLGAGVACSSATSVDRDAGDGDSDVDADADADGDADCDTPVPARHRAVAEVCDGTRSDIDYGAPDELDGGYVSCNAHDQCTEGVNGRCIGNGHDGWYCSYDQCRTDGECDGFVCECEGGFRSDHDVCLRSGNCLTDADCGPCGYCSPSFGDCGDYMGVVAYYCHTPEDDCIDDADCGDGTDWGPYCAYNLIAGRWTCSDSHCAG